MLYVTGDLHGDTLRWKEQLHPVLQPGDSIFITGDLGLVFRANQREEQFLDWLGEQEYQLLFVDGNHENFAKLQEYPVEQWNGGRVRRLRHNVLQLLRGEVFCIEGKTFFTFGGGFSIDCAFRTPGISWWPQEMPTPQEYQNAWDNLQRADNRVDFILTHTAPSETVYYLSTVRQFGIKSVVPEELPLTTFLDQIQQSVRYGHWYFGHFHVDSPLWRNQTALYETLRELETGEPVGEE